MGLHWRNKKNIKKKIDGMIDFIKKERKGGRALSCIISTIGITYVSEHKFAREYLKEVYKIEDNNKYI